MNAKKTQWFETFASKATKATGSNYAFITACIVILAWMVTGPIFHYSDTWQLVINTGTTIITFLMVFLIQKTQDKDAIAIQIKLNELIAATEKASNRIVNIEDLTEEELVGLNKYYAKLAEITKEEDNPQISHSIEDTAYLKDKKVKARKKMKTIT